MNRLKELRKNKKDTQQDIADILSMSRRGYQKLENGESQIKPDKAQALADYFGVSVGYLLGYSDKKLVYNDESQIIDKGLDKPLEFYEKNNMNRDDLVNMIIKTEDDEELIELGKVKLVSQVGKVPDEFWATLSDDFFRLLAIAPKEYFALLMTWALLEDDKRKAVLLLLQSFSDKKL